MNAKDALLFAGVGLGLYFLWKGKEFVEHATDEYIARPIGYVISRLTLPANLHINGGVVLPDGGYVSWDAIVNEGGKLDANSYFTWRGRRYRAVKRRADGNTDVVLA